MTKNSTRFWLPLLAILLLALSLRLFWIAAQSIWWDEAHSLYLARLDFAEFWNIPRTISYNHPPFYFLLLKFWKGLIGESEFSLRLLSAYLGVFNLAAIYRFARLYARHTASAAAMLICAVAPVLIAYSQEVRAYTLLPVLYILLLICVEKLIRRNDRGNASLWALLVILEIVSFYSGYFLVIGIIYVNALMGLAVLRGRLSAVRWVGSQLVALALVAPWVVNLVVSLPSIALNLGGVQAQADLAAILVNLGYFALGGNPLVVDRPPLLKVLITSVYVLSLVCVAILGVTRRNLSPWWRVFQHGLIPTILLLIVFRLWPQAQFRYFMPYLPILLASLGILIDALLRPPAPEVRAGRQWLAYSGGSLLMTGLAVVFSLALWTYYFVPGFYKDDARGVAAYLEAHTSDQSVIFVSSDDHSVPYYYHGPAEVILSVAEGESRKVSQFVDHAAGMEDIAIVKWLPETTDRHGLRPFLLELYGYYLGQVDYHGLQIHRYTLERPITGLPPVNPSTHPTSGPLSLIGVFYEPTATNDNAVTAMLRWQLTATTTANYAVSVRLLDAAGALLAQDDHLLYNDRNHPTSQWPAGAERHSFHVLPIPAGMLPGDYQLVVIVYAESGDALTWSTADGAESLALGQVAIEPGQHVVEDAYHTRDGWAWDQAAAEVQIGGLQLERFALRTHEFLPGAPVEVLLHWRVIRQDASFRLPSLALTSDELIWDEALEQPEMNTTTWSQGTSIITRHTLIYPAQSGPLNLELRPDGGDSLPLTSIHLNEQALMWSLPASASSGPDVVLTGAARLVGYELEEQPIRAGQPFRVILYWQRLPEVLDQAYTVFVQLLSADGRLIAQHDGPPAEGQRPLESWISGEIIADSHLLNFTDASYRGAATLIVGLYNPATLERLKTPDGSDHIGLPVTLVID